MLTPFKQLAKLLLTTLWLGLMVYGFYFVYSVITSGVEGHEGFKWPTMNLGNSLLLLGIFLLMFANWGIEALKWQRSVRDLERLSFFHAFKATLVGVSVSTWMPNRLGEYIGKIFYIKPQNRVRGAISGLYVSYTQIIATLFFGLLGTLYFLVRFSGEYDLAWAGAGIVMVLAAMIAFLVYKDRVINYLRVKNRYVRLFINTLVRYSIKEAWFFVGLSGLRFCVFNLQFVLALQLFGVDISIWDSFLLISLIYGLQTIIPATALSGLGIRGTISVFFLGYLTTNELGILSASYSIWVINLLVPSILGWFGLVMSPVRKEVKNYALGLIRVKTGNRQ